MQANCSTGQAATVGVRAVHVRAAALALLLPVAGALAMPAPAAAQTPPLLLLYNDRPPFVKKETNGGISGVAATPALEAFNKAGIAFELHEASPERQFEALKQNERRVCALGWYKNAEREQFAKFSLPFVQDSEIVALANKDFNFPAGQPVQALLARPDVRVLVKESIIYASYLDGLLAHMKAVRVGTAAEFAQMMKMVKAGRADLTFIPVEEARLYAAVAGQDLRDFNIIRFATPLPGSKRHLMCSMKVDDATLARLNQAIGQLPGSPKP